MTEERTTGTLFSLEGRVALVTGGAGRGYGAQAVKALSEAGARVYLTSREFERAQAAAEILRDAGFDVHPLYADLEDERSIAAAMDALAGNEGRLDVLVNNACTNHLQSFETVDVAAWNRVLSVNITGTMLMSRAAAPVMLQGAGGGGTMINISSIYGVVSPDQRIYGDSGINSPLVYGASKAAVIQMTRHLATYWAPRIRVNCLTPGGLFAAQDDRFVENYAARTPMGRMAGPDDLKGAVAYLASDASAWVTGQNLIVDGGWTAW